VQYTNHFSSEKSDNKSHVFGPEKAYLVRAGNVRGCKGGTIQTKSQMNLFSCIYMALVSHSM